MTGTAQSTPGTDLTAYLTNYPREVAFGNEKPDTVFDRYHTNDFVLVNDGLPLDRERLLAHMRPARKNALEVRTEVHETLTSGDRVAARYTLTAVMRRGIPIVTDIYLFGRLAADGRLHRVDQISRDVTPDPA